MNKDCIKAMDSNSVTNVLVFPAGEVNSVELHDALSTCVNVHVVGASSKERHGKYVFEDYISGLPLITDPDFIDAFNKIIDTKQISLIFPTHDTVLEFLAVHADLIHAKIVNGDKRTAEVCRDKALQYEVLKGCDFLPRIYDEISTYPVFLKERRGQGGVGTMIIKSPLDALPSNMHDYVINEYLPGEEVSVDCFTDKEGALIVIAPRTRARTMAGICAHGTTLTADGEIKRIAHEINNRILFRGLWFFQLKKNTNGEWRFLEVAARVASTMCLTRALGLNLPLMSVYTSKNLSVAATPNDYKVEVDRTLISRYTINYNWKRIYIDFDDTLIVRGKVNLKAIWLLYQCKNEGKEIVLLTKHKNEIYETMRDYAISKDVFSSIVHLEMSEKKSQHIIPQDSIFVDNAFQERLDVYNTHHIPVFDVDGIEVLMDWRI